MQTTRIEIRGIVQGVGFRPFVDRAAHACHLHGSVANKGSYVEVFAQGSREDVETFLTLLRTTAPERALVMKISSENLDMPPASGFAIVNSAREEGDIFVSPDIGICPRCQEELFDPANRRYLHPFINCTACGPRLTILDGMPYDRERTSMGTFPMCAACAWEYSHAETRRYDAQPVCCHDCGPRAYLLDSGEQGAITSARRCIMDGGIVAVKGIGGFHLCCDAANERAVARLRQVKQRPVKPFAFSASATWTPARKPRCKAGKNPLSSCSGDRGGESACRSLLAIPHWASCCPIRPCISCSSAIPMPCA